VTLGGRLDLTGSLVVLGGDTGHGVGPLVNEELVGSLLPLLVHRVRGGFGEQTDGTEDGERRGDTGDGAPEDLGAAARGVLSAGTVRSERDPVCY